MRLVVRKHKIYWNFFCYTVICILLIRFFPFLKNNWDCLLIMLGWLTMIPHIFFAGLSKYWYDKKEESEIRMQIQTMSTVCAAILLLSWGDRMSANDSLSHNIDGIVRDKFRDGRYFILQVEGPKGGRFRSISYPVYCKIKIGDKVYKDSMNPYGLINRHEEIFVDKDYWSGIRGILLPTSAVYETENDNRTGRK